MVRLLWTGIGVLIKHVGEDGALGNADRDIEEWLVERRTPSCDTLSLFGSMLSETAIKIVVTASLTRAEARRLNARTGHQPDEARPSEDPDRLAPRAPVQAGPERPSRVVIMWQPLERNRGRSWRRCGVGVAGLG